MSADDRDGLGADGGRGAGDGTLNLKQAAAALGVHYMTVYRYVRTGRLPARREGTSWVVDRAALTGFLAEETATAPGSGVDWEERLHDQLVCGDEAGAWAVVEGALVAGWVPEQVLVDLLIPAVAKTTPGQGAHVGHLVAVAAQRTSAVLVSRFRRRGRHRGTVVLGTPAGEDHSLGLALLADLLRLRNIAVLELGAGVSPLAFVAAAREADRLVAVGIGVTRTARLDRARRVVEALRADVPDVRVLLGGQAVGNEEVAAIVGGDAWAADVAAFADLIEAGLPEPKRAAEPAAAQKSSSKATDPVTPTW